MAIEELICATIKFIKASSTVSTKRLYLWNLLRAEIVEGIIRMKGSKK
jgi:hypothetical protein